MALPKIPDASVAISMRDTLYTSKVTDEPEHDVLQLDHSSRTRETLTISCPGPGIAFLRPCTAGPGHQNRENNPMQSRMDPGSQYSCSAASWAGEEKRPQPNLIPL